MSTTTAEGKPIAERPIQPDISIADPAPLGLAGFAMTTFVLSISNTTIWPSAAGGAVALALAYGGLAQLLAGMWEFKRNNTFGALAFSSYGAFWLSYWYLSEHIIPALAKDPATAGDIPALVGTYLLAWAVFTAYMTIASLRVSVAVAAVFILLTATYILLTIANYHANNSLLHAGGWVGVATAAAAWYASFAGVTNSTFKKTVLPVIPLTP